MPGRIVPLVAVLLGALVAAAALAPGRPGPAAARQASPAAGTPCPATTEAQNAALLRRLFEEAFGRGNFDAVNELLADDFVFGLPAGAVLTPAAQAPHPGRAAFAEAVRQVREDFPDLRVAVEEVVAEGDAVAARMHWVGTQADDLEGLGAPDTGRRAERSVWAFARVGCGKLAELRVLPDNLTLLRQLGIVDDGELADAGTPTVAAPAP